MEATSARRHGHGAGVGPLGVGSLGVAAWLAGENRAGGLSAGGVRAGLARIGGRGVALARGVAAARRRAGWGPRLIAGATGVPHSTVRAILRRHGLSRAPKAPREQVVRFEWPCPGDLLQMDTKRFARFTRPGHRVTGIRDRTGAEERMRVAWEFVHSVSDDHSRIAYSELQDDERADTVVAFLGRALAFYAGLGITPRRLQTDNAWIYIHNARSLPCSPSTRPGIAPSRHARPSATARSSATSRPWHASGPTASA